MPVPKRCAGLTDWSGRWPSGVRAARAAGLRCVGVPTLTHVELDADLVVPALDDAKLVGWAEGW